jgi:two-component system, pleD related family, response regulator
MVIKMKKTIDIYQKMLILIACASIIIIFGIFFNSNNIANSDNCTHTNIVVPDITEKIDLTTTKYVFHFNFSSGEQLSLHFITDLKTVQVFSNNTLIYDTGNKASTIEETSGKISHFIKLPTGKNTVTVLTHNKYMASNSDRISFRLGDQRFILTEQLIHALPHVIVYFLTFICGLALFLCWVVIRKYIENDKTALSFSWLLITAGLWLIRGSDFVCLLFTNHTALYYIGYILFLQIPALFFSFSIHYWQINCKVWKMNVYYFLSIANMVGCIILHTFNIIEFKQSSFFTHILLVITLFVALYGMVLHIQKLGLTLKIKLTIIPFILLILSVFTDYTGFYSNALTSYKRGGLIVLIFVLCIAIDILIDLAKQLREGQRNAVYKKLATTDILTGMYNRNAFEQWEIKQGREIADIGIALCDLNNLKFYNDNYGHELGDQYIIDAADIIMKAFDNKGECYRIGGDEFVVVVHHISNFDIQKTKQKMCDMENEYNSKSDILKIEIAFGYTATIETDHQISDIMKRADQLMYQEKKRLKYQKRI